MVTSGMLSIFGDRESAHAKLEARTTLRYVQCQLHTYIYIIEKIAHLPLRRLATLANHVFRLFS